MIFVLFVCLPLSTGFSIWSQYSLCSGCVSTQRGVELRRASSVQVWAAIQKKLFLNLEGDPPSTTGQYDGTVFVANAVWLKNFYS